MAINWKNTNEEETVATVTRKMRNYPDRFHCLVGEFIKRCSPRETNTIRTLKVYQKKDYHGKDSGDFLRDARDVLSCFDNGLSDVEIDGMKIPSVMKAIESSLHPEVEEKITRSQIETIIFSDYAEGITLDEYNSLSKKEKDEMLRNEASELSVRDCEGKTVGFALSVLAEMLGKKY